MNIKISLLCFLCILSLSSVFVVSCEFKLLNNLCRSKVYFFDVGQGDSIFFSVYEDFFKRITLLVDVGSFDSNLSEHIGQSLPFFDYFLDKEIDFIVITHTDEDHYGYFDQLKNKYGIGSMLLPCKGNHFILGDIDFFVLNPVCVDKGIPENNDESVVLKVESLTEDILLMGDASSKVENILMSEYGNFLNVDILKVGHHGSKYSTNLKFLKETTPKISIISVGRDNQYGHPDGGVIKNLENVQSRILMTKDIGNISFVLD